jgi:replicative DNA helicase
LAVSKREEYLPSEDSAPRAAQATEAEACVLGGALQWPAESLGACVEKFRGRPVFYDLRHQTIYLILLEMYDKQEAIDMVLVHQRLKDRGVLDQVGGIAYLGSLPDLVPSVACVPDYLTLVWEKYLLRTARERLVEGIAAIDAATRPAEQLLQLVEADISELTETHGSATEEHIKQPLKRVMIELENTYRRGSTQLRGLPTGPPGNFTDKVIGGIRPNYYVILAGRPGSGKTSLGMNWVEYWACEHLWWEECTPEQAQAATAVGGKVYQNEQTQQWSQEKKGIPVMVFSIEMDADSLTERLLFGRAGVDTAEFRQGFAAKGDEERLTVAMGQLAKSNIYVDSAPGQTIGAIAAKARRMVKRYGLKNPPKNTPALVFVLDYIQLVEQEGTNGMDRQKELTKISRKIMALKKQLACPWIVLAQMNRAVETAERERPPVLSDLKDCGALEQDCDVAVFTYKTPRKELEAESKDGGPSQQEIIDAVVKAPGAKPWDWSKVPYRVDLVVPKNRFGPTGHSQQVFCKNLCRFEDFHLWKLKHGVEERKAGESKSLALPTNEEMNLNP